MPTVNPIFQTVGVDDAVRVVLAELKRFAAPYKLPPLPEAANLRRYGDIDVFFDMQNDGIAIFHMVTFDDIEVSVSVDFVELDREYLDEIAVRVSNDINEHRGKRKPLIMN